MPGKERQGNKVAVLKGLISRCFKDVEIVTRFVLPGKERQGIKVALLKGLISRCFKDVEIVTSFL